MPARKVKTYLNNPNERKHREHRSKRGRSKNRGLWTKDGKKSRIDRISRLEELEDEVIKEELKDIYNKKYGCNTKSH